MQVRWKHFDLLLRAGATVQGNINKKFPGARRTRASVQTPNASNSRISQTLSYLSAFWFGRKAGRVACSWQLENKYLHVFQRLVRYKRRETIAVMSCHGFTKPSPFSTIFLVSRNVHFTTNRRIVKSRRVTNRLALTVEWHHKISRSTKFYFYFATLR